MDVHDVEAVPKARKWRTKSDKYKVIIKIINAKRVLALWCTGPN